MVEILKSKFQSLGKFRENDKFSLKSEICDPREKMKNHFEKYCLQHFPEDENGLISPKFREKREKAFPQAYREM